MDAVINIKRYTKISLSTATGFILIFGAIWAMVHLVTWGYEQGGWLSAIGAGAIGLPGAIMMIAVGVNTISLSSRRWLTFSDAMQKAAEGNRVRRKSWPIGDSIAIKWNSRGTHRYWVEFNDRIAKDWEVVNSRDAGGEDG